MPLSNDKDKAWEGWLVDGAGIHVDHYHGELVKALQARNIPKATVRPGRVNMWWRKDSLCIDVSSSMDGDIVATVHVQEYGTSLFVGRATESYKQTNYYKRMAASAFLATVDRCIRETIEAIAGAASVRAVGEA